MNEIQAGHGAGDNYRVTAAPSGPVLAPAPQPPNDAYARALAVQDRRLIVEQEIRRRSSR